MRFTYETCCVESDADSIIDMMDRAREVSFETVARHVGRDEIARVFPSYRDAFRIQDDYHVRYYSSRFQGRRAYVIVHSAIEYIFTRDVDRPAAGDSLRHAA